MGIFDGILGKGTVQTGGAAGGSGSGTGNTGSGQGLATAENNAIQVINNNQLDTAFLDALYAAGKLTPAARDAIIAGGDPSIYGLNQYDLYVLTVGRMGFRVAATSIGIVPPWAASSTYLPGQIVTWTQPGATGPGLYQAQAAAPAGTLPSNPTYWVQLAGPQQTAAIGLFSPSVAYVPGQLAIYQPGNSQYNGLYLCQVATTAGTLPTVTANWLQVSNPGPAILFDGDVTNPTLPAVSAQASAIGLQSTPGTAMSIQIPVGRRYRVQVFNARPVTAGQSTPTDCTLVVSSRLVETSSQDLNGNTVYTVAVVLTWLQVGNGTNSAIAAVTAGALTCRVRVELV